QTGEKGLRCPTIAAGTAEWPIEVRRSPAAGGRARSAGVGACTGTVPRGARRAGRSLSKETFASSRAEPEGRVREGPPGFWNTPSRKCGDLRMRAMRSPLGSTPKAAGRSARSAELREGEPATAPPGRVGRRSEEHTSELQSRENL